MAAIIIQTFRRYSSTRNNQFYQDSQKQCKYATTIFIINFQILFQIKKLFQTPRPNPMKSKLPPLPQLEHLKNKADLIPEIFFCGQIVGATDFQSNDALLCEMAVETGQYWELIYPGKQKTYQTQTTYAQNGEMFVWAHPFDLHFKVNELSGWPKLILKVWRFNESSSTNDLVAYGVTHLPKKSGFAEIQCEMWTPYGDWKFGALSYYLQSAPRLNNLNILSKDIEKRKKIFSQPAGKVLIEVQTIRKNFSTLQISQ